MEPAVHLAEVPLSVSRVDEVDERVESGHGNVRESQVQQEIVGDSPHPLVRQNNPNHYQVPEDRHGQYCAVSHRPQRDAPRRLHELVGQTSGCVFHSSGVLDPICFAQSAAARGLYKDAPQTRDVLKGHVTGEAERVLHMRLPSFNKSYKHINSLIVVFTF